MYIDSCKFNVLIDSSLSLEDLSINSADESVFNFTSIELCDELVIQKSINGTNQTFCSPIKEFFQDESKGIDLNKFTTYTITFKPIVVGLSSLDFVLKSTREVISFDIVVTQPRRVIDYVFDVYVYSFGVFISTMMGILLDKKCLLDIVKMPISVAIGFICQYLCMPIVSSFKVVS